MFLSFKHDLAKLLLGEDALLDQGQGLLKRGLDKKLHFVRGGCHFGWLGD